MKQRIKMLNTYVDALTMEETILEVKEVIENRKCIQHVVINAAKVNLIQQDEVLRDIVNNCELINADGQSILWAAKKLGYSLPERVTGIDLFQNLIEVSAEEGYKVFFFGAKEEVVKKVVQICQNKYPNLKIAGYRNGFFNENESKSIAECIRNSEADLLFVAFSSPKKEYWINKYKDFMQVPFCMGVGGSFDVIAGITKRAPKWMQKYGMEWFYRLIQEPKRMAKRYLIGNFQFLWNLIKCLIREKFNNKSKE